MIVKCRKCETRYRFDEGLIDGDGIWVRCSRCSSVFFQTRPSERVMPLFDEPTPEGLEAGHLRQVEEKIVGDALPELYLDQAGGDKDADTSSRLAANSGVVEPQKGRDDVASGLEEIGKTLEEAGDAAAADDISFRKDQITTPPKRSILGRLLAYFSLFLVLLALTGFSLYHFYPQESRDVLEKLLEQVPEAGRFLGLEKQMETVEHPVQFSDLRQRFIHNVILGSLRVVEGKLTNTGTYPLAGLKVKGEIWDAQGMIVGERVAYCGNILTDDELMTVTEDDIVKIAGRAEGSAFINDRLSPGGGIAFMIIFVRENAGAAKTMVRFAGAKRAN